jgi:hypothetical protein
MGRVALVAMLVAAATSNGVYEGNMTVGPFVLQLSKSQTIQLLAPTPGTDVDDGFAFNRGEHSLGGVTIRVRPAQSAAGNWSSWSWHSSPIIQSLAPAEGAFAAARLSFDPSSKGEAQSLPVSVVRQWELGAKNQSLVMRFTVTNNGTKPVEIGAFGIPLPFPWQAGSAAGDRASTFVDPAIGGQHGYATVTRLSGKGKVLIIAPADGAVRTSLEAWRSASELKGKQGDPGSPCEWMTHSKGNGAMPTASPAASPYASPIASPVKPRRRQRSKRPLLAEEQAPPFVVTYAFVN